MPGDIPQSWVSLESGIEGDRFFVRAKCPKRCVCKDVPFPVTSSTHSSNHSITPTLRSLIADYTPT